MSDEADTTTGTVTPEVEKQAKEMGWSPQDQFKGDPEKWVDAQAFVDRGQHVLPIVQATNRRLKSDLESTNTRLAHTQAALQESQEAIQALQEYHADEVKNKVEQARTKLLAELKTAKRDENIDREVELTDELQRLNTAQADAGQPAKGNGKDKAAPAKNWADDPVFKAWAEENHWYGEDEAKTMIAQGVAMKLRREGDATIGRPFMDKVSAGVIKEIQRLTGNTRGGPSKVEGGGPSGNDTGGGGKSYNDLPSEAKEACDKFARDTRLVGAGKIHKTQAEFRKHYATEYFKDI